MRKQSHLFRKILKTAMGVFLAGLLLWTAVYGSENGDRRKLGPQVQTSDMSRSIMGLRGPKPIGSEAASRSITRLDQASPTHKGE
jgi:hypothetical protein